MFKFKVDDSKTRTMSKYYHIYTNEWKTFEKLSIANLASGDDIQSLQKTDLEIETRPSQR